MANLPADEPEKIEALARWQLRGGEQGAAGAELGIAGRTLGRWRAESERAVAELARRDRRAGIDMEGLARRWYEASEMAIARLIEALPEATALEAARAAGIAVDRLLDIVQGRRGMAAVQVNIQRDSILAALPAEPGELRQLLAGLARSVDADADDE